MSAPPPLHFTCRVFPSHHESPLQSQRGVVTVSHDAVVFCPDPGLTCVGTYQLDTAFDQLSTTEEVFNTTLRPLVSTVYRGANATAVVVGEDEQTKSLFAEGRPASSLPGVYQMCIRALCQYQAEDGTVLFYGAIMHI